MLQQNSFCNTSLWKKKKKIKVCLRFSTSQEILAHPSVDGIDGIQYRWNIKLGRQSRKNPVVKAQMDRDNKMLFPQLWNHSFVDCKCYSMMNHDSIPGSKLNRHEFKAGFQTLLQLKKLCKSSHFSHCILLWLGCGPVGQEHLPLVDVCLYTRTTGSFLYRVLSWAYQQIQQMTVITWPD